MVHIFNVSTPIIKILAQRIQNSLCVITSNSAYLCTKECFLLIGVGEVNKLPANTTMEPANPSIKHLQRIYSQKRATLTLLLFLFAYQMPLLGS